MQLLSLTFHAEQNVVEEFKIYLENTFLPQVKNAHSQGGFIFSEVGSAMISEGKNYNLLLIFDDEESRAAYLGEKLPQIAEVILQNFGSQVMIFETQLHPLAWKFSK